MTRVVTGVTTRICLSQTVLTKVVVVVRSERILTGGQNVPEKKWECNERKEWKASLGRKVKKRGQVQEGKVRIDEKKRW